MKNWAVPPPLRTLVFKQCLLISFLWSHFFWISSRSHKFVSLLFTIGTHVDYLQYSKSLYFLFLFLSFLWSRLTGLFLTVPAFEIGSHFLSRRCCLPCVNVFPMKSPHLHRLNRCPDCIPAYTIVNSFGACSVLCSTKFVQGCSGH